MVAEILDLLLRLNLALAAAVLLVLVLRKLMRSWFGARSAYALWWTVPVALFVTALPARTVEVVAHAPTPHVTSVRAESIASASAPVLLAYSIDPSVLLLTAWLIGVIAMLVALAVRQRAFLVSLGKLSRGANGTRRAEANCSAPMIIGALWPKLVLPNDFEAQFQPHERAMMLAHERIHLRRGDPQINAIAALVRCICWFNPLAHVGANALRLDQELACDATVAEWYPRARRAYAQSMLKAQLLPTRLPIGCAWSPTGSHPLKLRIAMLKGDLPSASRSAAGLLLTAAICVSTGCATWMSQPPREVPSTPRSIASAQLLRAVMKDNVRRAEEAIDAGADVNVRSRKGLTALTIAARADHIAMVNLLLERGADVHLTSPSEGNALVAAGRRGQFRAVTALIKYGAHVNELVPGYGTPLASATRTGQFAVVRYLVEHGADVNLASPLPSPWDRWGVMRSPLEVATAGDHHAIATYLRSVGAVM